MKEEIRVEILLDERDKALLDAAEIYNGDKPFFDNNENEAINDMMRCMYKLIATRHGLTIYDLYGLKTKISKGLLCCARSGRNQDSDLFT